MLGMLVVPEEVDGQSRDDDDCKADESPDRFAKEKFDAPERLLPEKIELVFCG